MQSPMFQGLLLGSLLMITASTPCQGQEPGSPLAKDGKTDVSAALQALLDQAGKTGGEVLLEPGLYLVGQGLKIPTGVALKGSWEAPHHGAYDRGTTLLAVAGRGSETGPAFIEMTQSSSLIGVSILYPEQTSRDIQPYPWTLHGTGMHVTIENVTLINSYNGISFGPENNELHVIRNVFGCALRRGLQVDFCTDIGRVENVHFNPHYWLRSDFEKGEKSFDWEGVIRYQKENLEGFIFGKTDWEFVSSCFVIFAKRGFVFTNLGHGPGNVVLTQSGSDIGPCAAWIDLSQPHAGIQFANCQFMSTIHVGVKNQGPVKFSNCGFWTVEETTHQALLEGYGTTIFSACHFADWGIADPKAPCILARNGRVTVTACEFAADKAQITLEDSVRAAVISSNQFRGKERIAHRDAPSIQIGLNASSR